MFLYASQTKYRHQWSGNMEKSLWVKYHIFWDSKSVRDEDDYGMEDEAEALRKHSGGDKHHAPAEASPTSIRMRRMIIYHGVITDHHHIME